MRRWLGLLGRLALPLVWLAALSPILALTPAAVLDRAPGGGVRLTAFPVALAALDPYTWICARNSLLVATATTVVSGVLGVAGARVVVRWRFWGRRPLALLACLGIASPPAFAAIGLRWLGSASRWTAWLDSAAAPWPWLAWVWVAVASGAPIVAISAASRLSRIDSGWEDAAAWAGASRGGTWRHLVWPLARPEVARALGTVFALTLLEPGAPLVLGLRRTLGVQIVGSALEAPAPGQLTRAVVLTLLGLALAALGRLLIGWWGGRDLEGSEDEAAAAPAVRVVTAGWARALGFNGGLLLLVGLAWLPILGLAAASVQIQLQPQAGRVATGWNWNVSAYAGIANDLLDRRTLVNTVALGSAVVLIDTVLAAGLARFTATRPMLSGLTRALLAVPPLVVGVGALSLPALLAMAAEFLGASGTAVSLTGPLAEASESAAGLLDPDRTPGVLLVLGVSVARLPALWIASETRRRRRRTAAIDAAELLGARSGTARRLAEGARPLPSTAAAVLTAVLAATSLTPALVLAPTAETRPIAPAALERAEQPGDGLARASALASGVVALNILALALAIGTRGLTRTRILTLDLGGASDKGQR